MTGRRLWAIASIWVLTVGGASTLTWTVISSTGARVGQPVEVVNAAASEGGGDQAIRTSNGRGGRLTAECVGSSVALVTAVPDVGYWVKVYDPGPVTLRVDFESTDPDDYGEVRVTATCRVGSPVFERA